MGYTRGTKWPAPASYFQSGPIGFVYMLQIWFRYYFKEHISEQMLELETNDGILQLGTSGSSNVVGSNNTEDGGHGEVIQANSEGNCLNATGTFRFMADSSPDGQVDGHLDHGPGVGQRYDGSSVLWTHCSAADVALSALLRGAESQDHMGKNLNIPTPLALDRFRLNQTVAVFSHTSFGTG
jgi:hypothetical protein